jgi:hypothetical protein
MWAPRDEFHFAWKKMTGDFILQARVELVGTRRRPPPQAGLDRAQRAGRGLALRRRAVHGDGLTSLQFRKTKGAATEQVTSRDHRRRRRPARAQGQHLHHVRRALRRPVHGEHGRRSRSGRRGLRGLFLCSHNPDVVEKAVFRDVRSSAGQGRLRSLP